MRELTIDLKNYQSEKTVFCRTAVRGIINHGNKYLMIHSKYGEYKFPGGGQNDGETLIDTLRREVKEETGYTVKIDSVCEYLKLTEKRKAIDADVMLMTSYYYFCDVEDKVGERNLDDYEKEEDYQTVWLTLAEAMTYNESISDTERIPWVIRDTAVMNDLLTEKNKRGE